MGTNISSRAPRSQYKWPSEVGETSRITTLAKATSFRVFASVTGRKRGVRYSLKYGGTKNGISSFEVTRVS